MSCPGCLEPAAGRLLGEHRDPVAGGRYRLLRCPACALVYAEPRVSPGADFYRRVHSGETRSWGEDWRHRVFFDAGLTPGKLFDVGCGEGRFLLEARARGWTVSGVDFNGDYVAAARASGLEDVELGDVFDALSRRHGCAAITLFDALEHMSEPARLLEALRDALSPGGHLALAVPDAARPLLSEANRERYDFPPYHFTRWTEGSLRRALARAGFEPVIFLHSPLHLGFFAGQLYYRALYAVFPLLKRLFAGARPGDEHRTFSELLAKDGARSGALSDPGRRQRIIDAGYFAARVLLFPLDAPLVLAFRLLAPHRGRTLFALAKKR